MKTLKAFTLLELLLGISILSVAGLSVYTTFHTGIQLSRRSQEQSAIDRQLRWASKDLARDLENMVPFDFSSSYPDRSAVNGSGGEITFMLATPAGLKAVSYYLARADEGRINITVMGRRSKKNVTVENKTKKETRVRQLIRKERSWIDYVNGDAGENADSEVIGTQMAEDGLGFAYGVKENETTIKWKDAWTKPALPEYIRFDLQMIDPRHPNTPVTVTHTTAIAAANNALNKN